jgi:hypothetical protein
MNRRIGLARLTLGMIVAALVLTVGTSVAIAQGNGIVASATGSGQLIDPSNPSANRTFSFTARKDSSNNSSGQLELFNRGTGVRLHGEINCLNVVSGTATMSGTFTDANAAGAGFVGDPFWFQVVDNGEGAKAPPDLISLVFIFSPTGVPCSNTTFFPASIPITGGNIQVR